MDPSKVSAVTSWPVSESRKRLQRFLGFANFYRRFIWGYSTVAAPLTTLTSSKVPFPWSQAAEKAFQNLKAWFTSAPILLVPDPERQFIVEVDASDVGVGAVLSLNALLMTRKCSPVPSSPDVCLRQKEMMTLGTELLAVKLALEEIALPCMDGPQEP
ncbi:uncharacterized protein [Takifugu rubripes]|uniref:uncharacterized protein n=1 Tax=Takifugu rubripes TaxID=31033 RepID=UPI0011459A9E|nr:uncharacterized protein LOC115249997 [Takifugu rubripes]